MNYEGFYYRDALQKVFPVEMGYKWFYYRNALQKVFLFRNE